jgi:hypothetical protein
MNPLLMNNKVPSFLTIFNIHLLLGLTFTSWKPDELENVVAFLILTAEHLKC